MKAISTEAKPNVEPYRVPFTILIDSAESQPWTFQNIEGDADVDYRPLVIPTRWCSLGRHPKGYGDYSIEGFLHRCHVERKSIEDCVGTVLGWDSEYDRQNDLSGRRLRFKQELENLAGCEAAIVIVEGSIGDCLRWIDQHNHLSKKTVAENQKIFFRSVQGMMMDYRVPWQFCPSRRLAEKACYLWFKRFIEKLPKGERP